MRNKEIEPAYSTITSRRCRGWDNPEAPLVYPRKELTPTQRSMIRRSKKSNSILAKQYGISRQAVWKIRNRK